LSAVLIISTALLCFISTGCPGEKKETAEVEKTPLPPGVALIYPFHEVTPLAYGFGAVNDVKSRIIIADPRTGEKLLFLRSDGAISNLVQSPDRKYIAFDRLIPTDENPSPAVAYLMDIEDGEILDISSREEKAHRTFRPPSFSPDSKLITFGAEAWPSRQVRLFIYSMDDDTLYSPPEMGRGRTLDENGPKFTPDGTEILCTTKIESESGYIGDFSREMIAYNVKEDTFRVLAAYEKDVRLGVPYIGPENKYIYFEYTHADWSNHRIVKRMPIEGGEEETVFEEEYVLYLCGFVPEESLALLSYHIVEFQKRYVAVGDIETGEVELITSDDEDIELFTNSGIEHHSPDGGMILVRYHDITFDYWDIMVMDINAENRLNISVTATFDEPYAAWIVVPDGITVPAGGYEFE
jgi:hypothetical protein